MINDITLQSADGHRLPIGPAARADRFAGMRADTAKNPGQWRGLPDGGTRVFQPPPGKLLDIGLAILADRASLSARRQLQSQIVQYASIDANSAKIAFGFVNNNVVRVIAISRTHAISPIS
jgi:hypothetical protein